MSQFFNLKPKLILNDYRCMLHSKTANVLDVDTSLRVVQPLSTISMRTNAKTEAAGFPPSSIRN